MSITEKDLEIIINPEHTLYVICLQLKENKNIVIGKLGNYYFPKGKYLYIGSAKKNIKSRISRHLKKEKLFHWHFDYLRPHGDVINIETFDSTITECNLFEKKLLETKGQILVNRFGSSDCNCKSHLIYLGQIN